jgi:F420-dependent oxidoreductase-like protein
VAEGWHGQPYARPLERTRDYVAVVRMALRRERVAYRGGTIELPLPSGQGKALKLTVAPVQRPLPVYLAAMGPRNLALAGEIADGWLGFLFDPAHGGQITAALAEGAARAGRTLDGFDVAVTMQTRVDADIDAARDAMRPMVALYVGGMGSRERNFYNDLVRRYGFEEAAATVQDHYLEGRPDRAAAALPPELIDAVTVCGPAGRVRERLDALREAGVTTLIAIPTGRTTEDGLDQLRRLAEVAESAA